MTGWWVTMPAAVAGQAWTALTTAAATEKDARRAAGLEDPGLSALRVDALVEAILRGDPTILGTTSPASPAILGTTSATTTTGDPATAGDPTPGSDQAAGEVGPETLSTLARVARAHRVPRCRCGGGQVAAVIVDLPTALGLAENPGELPGYGPIPGPLARAMAADRDWIRWTTDPGTRQVIDRGARTYRPSRRMKAYLAARDRVCGFPGCTRPAQSCDCDHVVTFAHHGRTVTVNLGPLCRPHHNAKTHGGWRLAYDPDTGVKTWTSPLGRTYTKGTDPPLT